MAVHVTNLHVPVTLYMSCSADGLTGKVLDHPEMNLILGRLEDVGCLKVAHTVGGLTTQLKQLVTNL